LLPRSAVTVRGPRPTEELAQRERRSVQVDELTGRRSEASNASEFECTYRASGQLRGAVDVPPKQA
jgi:hypothetical protein